MFALPEGFHQAWLYARAAHVEYLIIESAGLFWLGAELAILYAMLFARRYVVAIPVPEALALSRRDWQRAIVWSAAFVTLCLVVLLRHNVLPSAHVRIQQSGSACAIEDVVRVFTQRNREHLAVWALFVTGWVVLEGLIVYHGWRVYRVIRVRFGGCGGRGKCATMLGTLLLLTVLSEVQADATVASGGALLQALQAAQEADAVYRNALYLYLRLAGVIWIGVEWVAAVLLWQGYRILRRAAEKSA